MIFYSKSTGDFYDKAIHGNAIPLDAVQVTTEYFAEMLAARSSGKIVVADESGYPIAIDQPAPVRTKESLLAELAATRWQVETGGILVAGRLIATDRESQAQLYSSYGSLKNGLIVDTYWKSADGEFTQVTLVELEPIAQAVAGHVRACFTAEKAHNESIDAMQTQAELDSYDINNGWPPGR
ncbi:DUF4376 domain-containing protein [Aeromonas hydrophila]|uniref:DUF4376 domain-containing protein n=1 Tax=Aeromonas hydrophila TaxID=644 RepID=UPI001FC8A6A8|nr:DUF4376 domain-containing protein [Aeromonas hydrophila]GKQ96492.1 hypothetical protein KAM461_07420 [Aeromonas hydrophila]